MPEEAREAAKEFLESPDLIRTLTSDFKTIGICREDGPATLLYLTGSSRRLRKPLAVIFQGGSSSGKSLVVENVAALFPEEAVVLATQITPQALFYMPPGSLSHKFVVCGERVAPKATMWRIRPVPCGRC